MINVHHIKKSKYPWVWMIDYNNSIVEISCKIKVPDLIEDFINMFITHGELQT